MKKTFSLFCAVLAAATIASTSYAGLYQRQTTIGPVVGTGTATSSLVDLTPCRGIPVAFAYSVAATEDESDCVGAPAELTTCCTGVGTGNCDAECTASADPYSCCTGSGAGTCDASCTDSNDPAPCCSGAQTGACNQEVTLEYALCNATGTCEAYTTHTDLVADTTGTLNSWVPIEWTDTKHGPYLKFQATGLAANSGDTVVTVDVYCQE